MNATLGASTGAMKRTRVLGWRQRVEAATVWLPKKRGQGVLVTGGLVLTAAHCIEWHTGGGMTLEDTYEVVETKAGARLLMRILFVDPVADLAVMGPPDDQGPPEVVEGYERFSGATAPVAVGDLAPPRAARRMRTRAIPVRQPDGSRRTVHIQMPRPVRPRTARVHVFTHHGGWIEGQALLSLEGAQGSRTWLRAHRKIEGGTSGGPIVDDRGRLLGVVSHSSEDDHGTGYNGAFPSPPRALPPWIWRDIEASAGER